MNICKRTIIMEVLGHAEIVPRFFSGPFFAVASWPKLLFPSVPGSARC